VQARARRAFPHKAPLEVSPGEGETLDAICGGEVRVLQRSSGYRFNLDPVLLAHFAAEAPGTTRGPLIDLGTGCGVVPLILARKFGWREMTAVEVQPSLYELARRNVHLNRCEGWIALVLEDLRQVERKLPAGGFAHVVCNPPYRAREAGRVNPDEEKAIARHEVLCGLEDVARAASHLLKERGVMSLVFPTERLCELVEVLRESRLEPKLLRLVHPRPDRPSRLLLLQAVKGGRTHLEVLPPLVVHAGEKGYSPEVRAMLEEGRPKGEREPDVAGEELESSPVPSLDLEPG